MVIEIIMRGPQTGERWYRRDKNSAGPQKTRDLLQATHYIRNVLKHIEQKHHGEMAWRSKRLKRAPVNFIVHACGAASHGYIRLNSAYGPECS
jgi:hypothetical protein